ncbi:MAG: DNA translocase FtsK 4TM domain-containing protein [Flavobacteriaceae bacterium]|nr:DNA translocase FtsK 4TM domain-containing protein [Flavobacteriaceae bacterium]
MATANSKKNKFSFSFKSEKKEMSSSRRLLYGSSLIILSFIFFISFTSYFFSGHIDQSSLSELLNRDIVSENWLGKLGAVLSHIFMHIGFGISSYILSFLILLSGVHVLLDLKNRKLIKNWLWGFYLMIFGSIFFALVERSGEYSGVIGYEINNLLADYIGVIGTSFLLFLLAMIYLTVRLNLRLEDVSRFYKMNWIYIQVSSIFKKRQKTINEEIQEASISNTVDDSTSNEEVKTEEETIVQEKADTETTKPKTDTTKEKKEIDIEVEKIIEEKSESDNLSDKLVENFGLFDPKLELGNFQFPSLDLLKKYDSEKINIDKDELEENKDRIVETLGNYNIKISSIKATVGPTVTLYEIIPDAGVRISKIKNLEDDIALSLSALGIRIIAPIPGRGTIGIEVPNKNSTIVSMHSVISSEKFQQSEMELPIAIGKTISNETLVVDLVKMPHLLMAGATGQGKSVGLNAVLTSLLYKKHPAEVKFVLVDPKKVELTLFNKIERHYLAKLPDSEDAIITDNKKVIYTLNSLCIEMDNRYELLKNASCRNIVEYNKKFKARKLNPNDGHQFLPYIILVIDEFADLIMTAGKEVETPIARLAQLARAIGIHLIIATQRPSVNVITGVIKANFPARIAFRVTSKIDSRTILDSSGADQLIGRGDMLFNQGNEIIRLQCAFVDTDEIEALTDYIGSQKAYVSAHNLPEYVGEESGTNLDIDIDDRDALFREAAEVIVIAQQGSASLLQRKLKLGYNRAGRLIDQLEAAGIVGPFEGSKARQVLVTDLQSLDKHLENE